MFFTPWLRSFSRRLRLPKFRRHQRMSPQQHQKLLHGPIIVSSRVEGLEERCVMTSPSFVSVQPNGGLFLSDGATLTESPRELMLQFSPGQTLDANTLGAVHVIGAGHDGEFTPAGTVTDFGTNGAVVLRLGAQRLGPDDNGKTLAVQVQNRGGNGPLVTADANGNLTLILDSNAGNATTAQKLLDYATTDVAAKQLLTAVKLSGNSAQSLVGNTSLSLNLSLTGAGAAYSVTQFGGVGTQLLFTANQPGVGGNDIAASARAGATGTLNQPGLSNNDVTLQINRLDLGNGTAPRINVVGKRIEVTLNDNATTPTTAQTLIDALNSHAQASVLINTSQIVGGNTTLAGIPDGTLIRLTGADRVLTASAAVNFQSTAGFLMQFQAKTQGVSGNDIILTFNKNAAAVTATPVVSVSGHRITVTLSSGANKTTAADLLTALANNAASNALISAKVVSGNGTTDLTTITAGTVISLGGADAQVAAGFRGLQPNQREVVYRFATALGDDKYRLEAIGSSASPLTNPPLTNTALEAINSGADVFQTFTLNLGAQVEGVVPQPVIRQQLITVNNVSNLTDGDTITVDPGTGVSLFTFEFNSGGVGAVRSGNIEIPFTGGDSAITVAGAIATAIQNATLASPDVTAANGGTNIVTVEGGAFDARLKLNLSNSAALSLAAGGIVQRRNLVNVYLNEDTLMSSLASDPRFYRLIETKDTLVSTDDVVRVPTSAPVYDPIHHTVTLNFGATLPDATYRLSIGESDESDNVKATALNVGSVFNAVTAFSQNAIIGDDFTQGNNDVDLYRIRVEAAGTITVNVAPGANLNTVIRLMNPNGTDVAGSPVNSDNSLGGADTLSLAVGAAGEYFIGVSSVGNAVYSILDGSNATGATGGADSYRVTITTNVAIPASDTTTVDSNSDFAGATSIGTLAETTQTVTASILPRSFVIPIFPGKDDELSHREVPAQSSHLSIVGDTTNAMTTFDYNFQLVIPRGPAGDPLNLYPNNITEPQKQRAREIFELYSRYAGIQFRETASSGITVATGDLRSVSQTATSTSGIAGLGALGSFAVMDGSSDWGQSEYGGGWFRTAMHEIGHAIGLFHAYEVPAIMGNPAVSPGVGGHQGALEPVYPGDADITHVQYIRRPDVNDIDLYKFVVDQTGTFTAETIAERSGTQPNYLNTALRLYHEDATTGVRTLVSQNDDYYANDSFISLTLSPGTYYVGVSSTGNTDYDPVMTDSGFGGRTSGNYQLKLRLDAPTTSSMGVLSGAVTGATNPVSPAPIVITSTGHKLTTGDQVTVSGVQGNTAANGTFTVTVIDANQFSLNGSTGNAAYTPGSGTWLRSTDIRFDGDADGKPSGAEDFYFRSDTTIYVDKSVITNTTNGLSALASANTVTVKDLSVFPSAPGFNIKIDNEVMAVTGISVATKTLTVTRNISGGLAVHAVGTAVRNALEDGTLARPYGLIETAVTDANGRAAVIAPDTVRAIIRIVGNGGADNDFSTVQDNRGYLLGQDANGRTLEDGLTFEIPKDVIVQIDSGAIIKAKLANIDVGTSQQNIDRSGGALQILGTPRQDVYLTSFENDAIGGDNDAVTDGAQASDWGGLVFRNDSDREAQGIFLNYVNHANMSFGGGQIVGVAQAFSPIYLETARPTVSHNTFTNNAGSAMTADPNSFDDALDRIGPDLHGNVLYANSINGISIRVQVNPTTGDPIDQLSVSARFDDTDITHVIGGNLTIVGNAGGSIRSAAGVTTARTGGRLAVDPGIVVKMQAARIEMLRGSSQFIAEGTAKDPVVITSILDDRFGSGASFDTTNNASAAGPTAGDWGGLVFNANSRGSVDHALIAYGGGSIPTESSFAEFNTVEIHQADVRLTNSTLENNADGQDGTSRNGRGTNTNATVFVRGAQPVLVNNVFQNNAGNIISINANALKSTVQADYGRSRGDIDRFIQFDNNHGPLVRLNAVDNNGTNGMEVRGEEITTETTWDDTDIVHVLRTTVITLQQHTFGGVRLQSNIGESLVIKLLGGAAGFTANGVPMDVDNRVDGTIHVLGMPGFPVVMTSLLDDTVGASLDPTGFPQTDTNNDNTQVTVNYLTASSNTLTVASTAGFPNGNILILVDREILLVNKQAGNTTTFNVVQKGVNGTQAANHSINAQVGRAPQAGDWNKILLDRYSNDRNVRTFNEEESGYSNGIDLNFNPTKSEYLGVLAANQKSGDDTNALGFEVRGFISTDRPADVDVYKFDAAPGTEIWIDIDSTSARLDSIVELIDAAGTLLAQSNNDDPTLAGGLTAGTPVTAYQLTKDNNLTAPGDTYAVTIRDAGMRLVLPALAAPSGQLPTYYVRVRSNPAAGNINDLSGGLTSGEYRLQIRLRQENELPGSVVRYADIRFADIGLDIQGLPAHSPFLAEVVEYNEVANGTYSTSIPIGNLLANDRNTINVSGNLTGQNDVDFYDFRLDYQFLQAIGSVNNGGKTWSTVFDIDYADKLSRADTILSVYDNNVGLVLIGTDSNIDDDRSAPGQGNDLDDLNRGSAGDRDPFIGSVQLTELNDKVYKVAVSSNANMPTPMQQFFTADAPITTTRVEPINTVTRIVEDHIGYQSYMTNDFAFGAPPRLDVPAPAPRQTDGLFNTTAFTTSNAGAQELSLYVKPWTFADVSLFTASAGGHSIVNPFDGNAVVGLGNLPAGSFDDIAMRPDGLMFGLSNNQYYQLNGDGSSTFLGNDNIPNNSGSSDHGGMAFRGQAGNSGSYELFVANNDRYNADGDTATGAGGDEANPGIFRLNPNTGAAFDESSANGFQRLGNLPGAASIGAITGATNTSDIVITSVAHGLFTGAVVTISGVVGNTAANGTFTITVTGVNTFSLDGSAGNGAYTSGGIWTSAATAARITGLAFADPTSLTLYAVDDAGNLWRSILGGSSGTGTGLGQGNRFLGAWTRVASQVAGPGVGFEGLTLGPQNIDDGAWAGILFATGDDGNLYAIDPLDADGDLNFLAHVYDTTGDGVGDFNFDTNADGVADALSVPLGGSTGQGLAFSLLDFNLWHPTNRRAADVGHGINTPFDFSRTPTSSGTSHTANGTSYNESAGGTSFYFGLEQWVSNPQAGGNQNYYDYGTGAQFGVRSSQFQRDLSSNAVVTNTYNMTGGAYGSLFTNSFSLEGYDKLDKPTMYFNYFLDTEGSNGPNMRDAARVFVSPDNGTTWTLLATNNSDRGSTIRELPTFQSYTSTVSQDTRQHVQELFDPVTGQANNKVWRQARVDLGSFAGQSNLRFRFDFSTSGSVNDTTVDGVSTNASGLVTGTSSGTISGNYNAANRGGNNSREGFYIDDIIVGFAERGEMVTGTAPDQLTFTALPANGSGIAEELAGEYQLEIRRGSDLQTTEYAGNHSEASGSITISNTFDTNDRLTNGLMITTPTPDRINDGDTFTINNGLTTKTYEFDTLANGVTGTNIAITVAGGDTEGTLATKLASAINTTAGFNVLATLKASARNSGQIQLEGAMDYLATAVTTTAAVTPDVMVAITQTSLLENSGAVTFTVSRTGSTAAPLNVTLNARDAATGALTAQATLNGAGNTVVVTIPAGQASINTTTFQPIDDGGPIGIATRPIVITATAAGFNGISDTIDVLDFDTFGAFGAPLTLRMDLSRTTVNENERGGTLTGYISLPNPFKVGADILDPYDAINGPLTVYLFTDDGSESRVIGSVTFQDGDMRKSFIVNLIDEFFNDGPKNVTLTAMAPGYSSVRQNITVSATDHVDTYLRKGDDNFHREQGHIQVESNLILDSRTRGIRVDNGTRDVLGSLSHPGGVINYQPLNNGLLFPGVTIVNNVVARFGNGAGIELSGDSNGGNPPAAIPFSKIINNTIYGGTGTGAQATGTGIMIDQGASPTLTNNIIVNTSRGISWDGINQAPTPSSLVIGTSFYQGNNNNTFNTSNGFGITENNALTLATGVQLFINPLTNNFYLAPGTQAIDSSLDKLGERPALNVVKSPLAIPDSLINAPNLDLYGQTRVDDSNQSPPPGLGGSGSSIFKDRGAVERADFQGGITSLIVPDDDGTGDLDLLPYQITVDAPLVIDQNTIPFFTQNAFVVKLTDSGVGIDDATVDTTQFVLTQTTFDTATNTIITKTLLDNVDYIFAYNANTNEAILTSVTTYPQDARYQLFVNNSANDPLNPAPFATTGIRDFAGNDLIANQGAGSVRFDVLVTNGKNDAPDVLLPLVPSTLEDTTITFSGANKIQLTDPDAFLSNGLLQIEIQATGGTFTLGSANNLNFSINGDPLGNDVGSALNTATFTGLVRFHGTLADINSALDNLSFKPNQDLVNDPSVVLNNDTVSLQIRVNDLGEYWINPSNGQKDRKQITEVMSINVRPVNDAPFFNIPPAPSFAEDQGLPGSVTVMGFATAMATSTLASANDTGSTTTGPQDGNQTLLPFIVTVTSETIDPGFTGVTTIFQTAPSINAAGDLTFQLKPNVWGTATIDVTLTDSGPNGGVNGDVNFLKKTFTLTVNKANDKPSLTFGTAPTVLEDSNDVGQPANTHVVSNFASFVDGDPEVIQTWASSNFTNAVSDRGFAGVGTIFSSIAFNTSTGTLTYTLMPNVNGQITVTMTATDGGEGYGGVGAVSDPLMFVLNVTPLNDKPSVQVNGAPFPFDSSTLVNAQAGINTPNFVTPMFGPVTALDENSLVIPPGQSVFAPNGYTVSAPSTLIGDLGFSVNPTINNAGALSYTANGTTTSGIAVVTVTLRDDGGTALAGEVDTSDPVDFYIAVGIATLPTVYPVGAHNITLILNGADIEVRNTATNALLQTYTPGMVVGGLLISGNGNSNTITFDYTNGAPIPANVGVILSGGLGADSIVLTGGSALSVDHTFAQGDRGKITITDGGGARDINYIQFETPISDALVTTNRSFTFSDVNDEVTLADDAGAVAGVSSISSVVATTATKSSIGVNFTSTNLVASSITINTDSATGTGNDILQVTGFDSVLDTQTFNGIGGGDLLIGRATANTFSIHGNGVNTNDVGSLNATGAFNSFESLQGGAADDVFSFTDGTQSLTGTISGQGGNDTLSYAAYTAGTGGGVVVSLANNSATRVFGALANGLAGIETVFGGAGGDRLTGSASGDRLDGNDGDDTLTDGFGNDTLNGGAGNDTYVLTPGSADSLIDSAGTDTIDFSFASQGIGTAGTPFNLDTTTAQTVFGVHTVTLGASVFENFIGSGMTDFVAVTSNTVIRNINGNGGNDRLTGPNATNLWTMTGSDAGTITNTTPAIFLTFSSVESLLGGSGTDTLSHAGLAGAATINLENRTDNLLTGTFSGFESFVGGNGNDTLIGHNITNAWNVASANTGTLVNDNGTFAFSAIETLTGGSGSDTVLAPNLANVWNLTGAGSGNITGLINYTDMENLTGNANTDSFVFGMAAGSITGTINGGTGIDTLNYSALTTPASVNLQTGAATRTGGFTIDSIESVIGGSGSDTLTGKDANTVWSITSNNAGSAVAASVPLTVNFSGVENLAGGSATDSFVFSDGVVVGSAGVAGSINGGGGTGDSVTFAAYGAGRTVAVNFALNQVTANLPAANVFGFSNIETVTGTSNTGDSVTGHNASNAWNISGTNSGTWVSSGATYTFSQIETVTGGANTDNFVFGAAGVLAGSINGGSGLDTLNLAAKSGPIVVTLTAVDNLLGFTGSETGGSSAFTGFTGINALVGSTTNTSDSLTGLNNTTTWELDGTNRYIDGLASLDFSSFELLNAGTGDNTFQISGAQTFNLSGNIGNDQFVMNTGATLTGFVDGNGGNDTLSYNTAISPITFGLSNTGTTDGFDGTATGISAGFRDINTLSGGSGSDILNGLASTAAFWNLGATRTYLSTNTITFSNIENLNGGSVVDTFNVSASLSANLSGKDGNDLFNFSNNAVLTGTIDGGSPVVGGPGVPPGDTLDFSAVSNTVGVNLNLGSIISIETIKGTTTNNDTLTGAAGGTIFNITAPNTVTVNGVAITGFENLAGSNGNDSFIFTGTGSISGVINGGLGTDTLDYSALSPRDVTVSALGSQDGFNGDEASVIGGFQNINVIVGSSLGEDILRGSDIGLDLEEVWTLGVALKTYFADGRLLTFSGFESLFGGAGADRFNISGAQTFDLDGGASDGIDTFDFANNATLDGGITAGLGNDTLTFALYTTAITVTLDSNGTPEGFGGKTTTPAALISGRFDGIDTIIGGSASDTLIGLDQDAAWEVDGTNRYSNPGIDPSLLMDFLSWENLRGGSSSDTFTITGDQSTNMNGGGGSDSFILTPVSNLTGTIDGGSDPGDVFDLSAKPGPISLNVSNLLGFESVIGTSGNDTLVGAAGGSTFTIFDADLVEVNGNIFQSFENLLGGGGADTFIFDDSTATPSLSGTISGGLGGDTVDFSPMSSGQTIVLSGLGSVDGFNGDASVMTGGFQNIDSVIGSTAGDTFQGTNASATWTSGAGGSINYTTTRTFNILGVNTLLGGSGIDTLLLTGGATTVQTFDGGSGNDVLNASGITTQITLLGGEGNDTLTGGSADDNLDGGNGTNQVNATFSGTMTLTDGSLARTGLDSDTLISITRASLSGGATADIINAVGFTGFTTISGAAGNDTITGGSGSDSIDGGADNDSISGGNGSDTLVGGTQGAGGSDTLFESVSGTLTVTATTMTGLGTDSYSGFERVSLTGGAGADTINGSTATTPLILVGGAGNDVLIGGTGNDTINGGDDSDLITGGLGNDALLGGEGGTDVDVFLGTGSGTITLTAAGTTGALGTDTYGEFEGASITGSSAADTINAATATIPVTLVGGGGNDKLTGGTGDDQLRGEAGNDTLTGSGGTDIVVDSGNVNFTLNATQLIGNGTDTLATIERVSLVGGASANTLTISGFAGAVSLDGAGGDDTLVVSANVATMTLTNTMLVGVGGGVTIVNLEQARLTTTFAAGGTINAGAFTLGKTTLTGGAGADTLTGGTQADSISGGSGGKDVLYGGDGNDTLDGGSGGTTVGTIITAANRDDVIHGGMGNDSIRGQTGNDYLFGEDGDDTIDGGAGNDAIDTGNAGGPLNRDSVIGGDGNDAIRGGNGNDVLNGGNGNDTILGGSGSDNILGGAGNDMLRGEQDGDTLSGQTGTDTLDSVTNASGVDTLVGIVGDVTAAFTFDFDALIAGIP